MRRVARSRTRSSPPTTAASTSWTARRLKSAKNIPLEGFNRVNPAGDDRHVMVSTGTGFRVLDALAGQTSPTSSSRGPSPGTSSATRARRCSSPTAPARSRLRLPKSGREEARQDAPTPPPTPTTVSPSNWPTANWSPPSAPRRSASASLVLDKNRKEIARNEKCPGVHGEAAAQERGHRHRLRGRHPDLQGRHHQEDEEPHDYGRIGNQAGSRQLPVVLGDYKKDADAELERPSRCPSSTPRRARCDWSTSAPATPSARWPRPAGRGARPGHRRRRSTSSTPRRGKVDEEDPGCRQVAGAAGLAAGPPSPVRPRPNRLRLRPGHESCCTPSTSSPENSRRRPPCRRPPTSSAAYTTNTA